MFSFLKKKKDIEEIKLKAKLEGFRQAESIMAEEIATVRTECKTEKDELLKKHDKDIKEEREKTELRLGARVLELRDEVESLKSQLLRSRKGWSLFKNFVSRSVEIMHLVKTQAEIEANKAARKFSIDAEYETELEVMQKKLEDLTPKIEGFLGSEDDDLIQLKKEGAK
jgi:hypothetical protein